MLYQIHEQQLALNRPLTQFAQAANRALTNSLPWVRSNIFIQRLAAGYDLFNRLNQEYQKPEFKLTSVVSAGTSVPVVETVAMHKSFCELRHFHREARGPLAKKLAAQPVVLLVAPLSGHYATLLRDTVATMLQDHQVYVTDWTNAKLVPLAEGEFHLDDYVNYVSEFIWHLQSIHGNCHVVSVCQPTVPVLGAISLMASRGELTPLSMTMMGGPMDARKSPTSVNDFAISKSYEWFERNVIYPVPRNYPGAGRKVYPGFLQHAGFVAMNPENHAKRHKAYFEDVANGNKAGADAYRKFYDEYEAVLDMDADFYLETIKVVFQDYSLARGVWDVRSEQGVLERVRPQDISTTAVLSVEGELDDIAGIGQTSSIHDMCSSIPDEKHRRVMIQGAGHYGIFSGHRWHEVTYPAVTQFIKDHHQG